MHTLLFPGEQWILYPDSLVGVTSITPSWASRPPFLSLTSHRYEISVVRRLAAPARFQGAPK